MLISMHRIRRKYKKLANQNSKLSVTAEQYRNYYKFTFVRNPWARAYSWYQNVMRDELHQKSYGLDGELSFDEFLPRFSGKGLLKPQTYWLKDFKGNISLNFIGRFENLHNDFRKACEEMNLPPIELTHQIKGSGEDYKQHYNSETIALVEEVYKEEIEMFGYTFNS